MYIKSYNQSLSEVTIVAASLISLQQLYPTHDQLLSIESLQKQSLAKHLNMMTEKNKNVKIFLMQYKSYGKKEEPATT